MGLIGRIKRKYCGYTPSKQTKTGGKYDLVSLYDHYIEKWQDCYIPSKYKDGLAIRVKKLLFLEDEYREFANACAVEINFAHPWFMGAALHYRENNNKFNGHMHNGDPLTKRTIHVPKGRPKKGNPPFSFTASYVDAMDKMKTSQVERWNIPALLWFMERYNGFGYLKRGIMSPYIWSWTNHYTTGMYTSDGKFNPNKQDPRPGCAALLKYMLQNNHIKLLE